MILYKKSKKIPPCALFFFCILISFCIPNTSYAEFKKIKIAVLDFRLQGSDFQTEDMGKIVAEWLITAFVREGRFDVIERKLLGEVLEEQKMVEAGIVSKDTASEIGKLLGVKVIISGSVVKIGDVVEVNARIVDVASASIITAESVRSERVTSLRNLVQQMAGKIIKNFPLEGYIAHRENNSIVLDIGKQSGVKLGMHFLVYKDGDVVKHPKSGKVLHIAQVKTGLIRITSVQEKTSTATIISETEPNSIVYGLLVKSTKKAETAPAKKTSITRLTSKIWKKHVTSEEQATIEEVVPTDIYQNQNGSIITTEAPDSMGLVGPIEEVNTSQDSSSMIGYIVKKDPKTVVISIGSSSGLTPGASFIVFKEGEIIKHPKTGEMLKVEQLLTGRITITAVHFKMAEAKILSEESGGIKYGQQIQQVNSFARSDLPPGISSQKAVKKPINKPKQDFQEIQEKVSLQKNSNQSQKKIEQNFQTQPTTTHPKQRNGRPKIRKGPPRAQNNFQNDDY